MSNFLRDIVYNDVIDPREGVKVLGDLVDGIQSDIKGLFTIEINIKNPPSPLTGAKGDGSDETKIIQDILNTVDHNYKVIIPEGTFGVQNLVIPDKKVFIEQRGFIKKLAGGDNDYVVASANYVNNNAYAGTPFYYTNPKIDGGGIATNGLVIQTWDSVVSAGDITNCVNGIKMTAQTKDGTNFTTSTLVNNKIFYPNIHHNTGNGIWINDPSRNKITDYFIIGGIVEGNKRALHLDSCAGALISGTHTYGSSEKAVHISLGTLALRIKGCYFEEPEAIDITDILANNFVNLEGNIINGRVRVYSGNANTGVQSANNTFRTSTGKFIQKWGSTIVYSNGDVFEASDPYVNVGADGSPTSAAPNVFITTKCVSIGLGTDRQIDGAVIGNAIKTTSYVTAIPTSGSYVAGHTAINTSHTEVGTAGSKYVVEKWRRLTTGSGHVLNTDWREYRTYTGN